MAVNEFTILDLEDEIFSRSKGDTRVTKQDTEKINQLERLRDIQKKSNFKRGALLRKYNKLEGKEKIALKKELSRIPKFNLKIIDNRIKKLSGEYYYVTVDYKFGKINISAKRLKQMKDPARWILDMISKKVSEIPDDAPGKEKLMMKINANYNALDTGEFEDIGETEPPIFMEWIGQVIIVRL